jgi:regulator of RNase E activity RraB
MATEDELKRQREGDLQVIAALQSYGSDLTQTHRIEHHFNSYSEEDANNIVHWGTENGFEPSSISSGQFEGQHYFYFDLIKDTVPQIDLVFADTSRLLDVAKKHNSIYDGWGCMIVKEE